MLLQLTKLRSKSAHTPVSAGSKLPAEQEVGSDDVALLRQRVAELEHLLLESKTHVNAAVNGEETGWFI